MIEYKPDEAPAGWINGLPASGQLDDSGKGYLAMTARDVATLRAMSERGDRLTFRPMVSSKGAASEFDVCVEIPPPSQATIVIVGVVTAS